MKTIFYTTVFFLLLGMMNVYSQTGVPVPSMIQADQEIQAFMDQWNLPGGSFAISKDEKLVYARGFGYADLDRTELVQPHHQFRLASISKTFTSVGIMHLVEDGLLSLEDTVFGVNGILSDAIYGPISDSRIYQITVRNLMEHSGGWDRNTSGDLIFAYNATANYFQIPLPVSDTMMIRYAMTRPLDFDPGTRFAYSNLGWMLLGRIIADVSGLPYETYIQQVVTEPIHAYSAELGNSLREDKARREVEYFSNPGASLIPSVLGPSTPSLVPAAYGGFDMKIAGSAGAWISNAKDLLKYLASVDRDPNRPDQLDDTTLQAMLTPAAHSAFYARGWELPASGGWGHGGAISEGRTYFYKRNGGVSWAILINSSPASSSFGNAMITTMERASNITTWPTHDLFDVPEQPAAGMSFSQVTDTSMDVSITPGDGFGRILVVREENAVSHVPADGVTYLPNTSFGQGTDLGAGEYTLANGNPSLVTVKGLEPGRTYHFEVFEWNRTTGGYPIYLTSRSLRGSQQTTGANSLEPETDFAQWNLYPNPASNFTQIQLENDLRGELQLQIINSLGQRMQAYTIAKTSQSLSHRINLDQLAKGKYMLLLTAGDQLLTKTLIKK